MLMYTRFDFYPRPPRGGRPAYPSTSTALCEDFYPRPPRGGRRSNPARRIQPHHFYPRPPRGGRLGRLCLTVPIPMISIHALREEGDARCCNCCIMPVYFYPRPPRGGRHQGWKNALCQIDFYPRPPRGGRRPAPARPRRTAQFLSTPSARRATFAYLKISKKPHISIHALREEGDSAR